LKGIEYAEKTIKLNSKWSKGYFRKALCLESLGNYDDAKKNYEIALDLDENNIDILNSLKNLNKNI
jgi:tetratricopeptide (TPR) repeat protein